MSLNDESRPKRPPYQDVANSQAALGIAGSFCVCGGESMFNQLSIVSLDQPKNAYNHTELALPTGSSTSANSSDGQAAENTSYSSSRRFQRRGEMKAIVNAATLRTKDSSHYALLELDDGSLVQEQPKVRNRMIRVLPWPLQKPPVSLDFLQISGTDPSALQTCQVLLLRRQVCTMPIPRRDVSSSVLLKG